MASVAADDPFAFARAALEPSEVLCFCGCSPDPHAPDTCCHASSYRECATRSTSSRVYVCATDDVCRKKCNTHNAPNNRRRHFVRAM